MPQLLPLLQNRTVGFLVRLLEKNRGYTHRPSVKTCNGLFSTPTPLADNKQSQEAYYLAQLHQVRLLTTRVRITVALGLTAFVLALAMRGGLHLGRTESGSLLPFDAFLHGWALLAANVALYLYLCWLGFWFIRGTAGPERFFMVGWFANILPGPIEIMRPQWAGAIRHIGIFGLGVALLAALALLLTPADASGSSGTTDAT
jgi:hypothetical protein